MIKDLFGPEEVLYYAAGVDKPLGLKTALEAPPAAVFYSINPLDSNWQTRATTLPKRPSTPRFSLNVSNFRNFIFESDTAELSEQLQEWKKTSELLPLKQLTFSGGKSYHAVISCLDELPFEPHTDEGVAGYKQAWTALATFIKAHSSLQLDESTKDPARLTRLPGAFRNSIEQHEVSLPLSRYISCAEVMEIMGQYSSHKGLSASQLQDPQLLAMPLKLALQHTSQTKLANRIYRAERWASSENMYPALFRLTLWALDSLTPSFVDWAALMEAEVFPKLRAAGYTRNLTLPLKAAYSYKGIRT